MGGKGSGRSRSFDYAEARRLRWVVGLPAWYVADLLGVSVWAIRRACSAERRAYERDQGKRRRARDKQV